MLNRARALLFHNDNTRQTVVKNIFWLTIGQLVSRVIRAIIIIYAARVLGAGEYGIFSYALGLSGFFTIFADIGINNVLTREIAQKPESVKKYFSTALVIKLVLLFITSILIMFVAPHFSKLETVKTLIPLVVLLTIFDNVREFASAFFRGKERMELEAITTTIMNIAITGLGFLALSIVLNAQSLMTSYVGSVCMGMLIALFLLRKQFVGITKSFDSSLIRPIIKAAAQIGVTGLLGVFMLNVDTIMLGWWKSAEAIGYYAAGQRIVQLLYILPAILASALFPALSRIVTRESEKVGRMMERALTLGYLVVIPVTFGGVMLASPIIHLLYGEAYTPAILAFQILMATVFVSFPGTLFSNLIFAKNQQKKMVTITIITSAGNVIFNTLLIPTLGIAGAALATLIMQTIYNILAYRVAKTLSMFRVFHGTKMLFIAGVIMVILGIILNALGIHIIVTIVACALCYFILLFFLKNKVMMEDVLPLLKKLKS